MAEPSASERTEAPTPRRLAEARRRGDVPRSRDLQAAAVLAAAAAAIAWGAPLAVARLVAYLRRVMADAGGRGLAGWAAEALAESTAVLAPPLLAVAAGAVAVGLAQTRGLVAPAALRFDPARVAPRLGRLVSASAFAELLLALVRIGVLGAVAALALWPLVGAVGRTAGGGAAALLAVLATGAQAVAIPLLAAAVALGAADWLWQRARHRRGLRMTREEVKRESKDSEGDPRHRAERQRLHRELAEQRMLADIRKADCVIVNPDHIAVALRYDRGGEAAPVVVAKGERLLAEKIKQVAREAGVPIFRDVPLARALAALEEGDEIPEALYEAVAEILREVYGAETLSAAPPPPPSWRRA